MKRALTWVGLVVVGLLIGWWFTFTLYFLTSVVPHGGAW